jgi:hypothetical protein
MLWWCLMLEMTEIFNFQPASTWTISRSQWDQLRKVRVSGAGRPAGACKYNPTLLDVSRVWPVCKMDSLCFFSTDGLKRVRLQRSCPEFSGSCCLSPRKLFMQGYSPDSPAFKLIFKMI